MEHYLRELLAAEGDFAGRRTEKGVKLGLWGGAAARNYCLVRLSGPLFVTVPKSPREVMSVVPVIDVPFTLPWNVISTEPPSGNCC